MSLSPFDSDVSPLVAAAPFERLLARLEDEIRWRGRRLSPDTRSLELEMLRSCASDLRAALDESREMQAIGNVKDAAGLVRRPESTVRRICGRAKERAGARRVEGEWSIELATFLAFYRSAAGGSDDAPEADAATLADARNVSASVPVVAAQPIPIARKLARRPPSTPSGGAALRSRRARAKAAPRA